MTIILNITKSILIEQIERQVTESSQKDTAPTGLLGYFAPPRNIQLSSQKRELLTQLISEICTITATEDLDDKQHIVAIIHALRTCKQKTSSASGSAKQPLSSTERLLDHLCLFTEDFYNLAQALQLHNQPCTEDSFTCFMKACGFYFARRTLDNCQITVFKSILENPHVTPHHVFYQRLDQLVNQTLHFGWQTIHALRSKDPNIIAIKTALGVQCIELLLLQHKQLRDEYSSTLGQFYLRNYLDEYLTEARQRIAYVPQQFETPSVDVEVATAAVAT